MSCYLFWVFHGVNGRIEGEEEEQQGKKGREGWGGNDQFGGLREGEIREREWRGGGGGLPLDRISNQYDLAVMLVKLITTSS